MRNSCGHRFANFTLREGVECRNFFIPLMLKKRSLGNSDSLYANGSFKKNKDSGVGEMENIKIGLFFQDAASMDIKSPTRENIALLPNVAPLTALYFNAVDSINQQVIRVVIGGRFDLATITFQSYLDGDLSIATYGRRKHSFGKRIAVPSQFTVVLRTIFPSRQNVTTRCDAGMRRSGLAPVQFEVSMLVEAPPVLRAVTTSAMLSFAPRYGTSLSAVFFDWVRSASEFQEAVIVQMAVPESAVLYLFTARNSATDPCLIDSQGRTPERIRLLLT